MLLQIAKCDILALTLNIHGYRISKVLHPTYIVDEIETEKVEFEF